MKDDEMRRIPATRASGLGCRGSIDDPASWLPAIERCTRRCRDPLEREFVIGEVLDALVRAWRAGTCVGSFWGFVKAIARRVAARRRQRQCPQIGRTTEEPVAGVQVERWLPSRLEIRALLRRVRGHRRRSLLRELARGRPLLIIAERRGMDMAKVYAMVRDLLDHLGIVSELPAGFFRGCSVVARRGLGERVAGKQQNLEAIPDVPGT